MCDILNNEYEMITPIRCWLFSFQKSNVCVKLALFKQLWENFYCKGVVHMQSINNKLYL